MTENTVNTLEAGEVSSRLEDVTEPPPPMPEEPADLNPDQREATARMVRQAKDAGIALTVCGFTWGVAAIACNGAIGAVPVVAGDYRGSAKTAVLGGASFVGGRLAYAAVKRASGLVTMSNGVARRGKGAAQAATPLLKGTTRFRSSLRT